MPTWNTSTWPSRALATTTPAAQSHMIIEDPSASPTATKNLQSAEKFNPVIIRTDASISICVSEVELQWPLLISPESHIINLHDFPISALATRSCSGCVVSAVISPVWPTEQYYDIRNEIVMY